MKLSHQSDSSLLNNIFIFVLNYYLFVSVLFTNNTPISDAIPSGQSLLLECYKPVAGRYLVLYLNYTNALTICELRVYSSE